MFCLGKSASKVDYQYSWCILLTALGDTSLFIFIENTDNFGWISHWKT